MLLKHKKLLACAFVILAPSMSSANRFEVMNNIIQSIQVINLLANNTLVDPGMTPTGIFVRYYNGANNPCWTSTLGYQQDTTIHAGPTQGCVAKINRIEIVPLVVYDKLKTYQGPINISIDTSKFANQITVFQDQPPTFDGNTGLVSSSGSIQSKVQAQYKD